MNIRFSVAAGVALFLATPAVAADLQLATVDYPVVYEQPSYDWTGFYVGVVGGAAGGDFNFSVDDFDLDLDITAGGLLGGIQVGGDYQMDNFVIGIVADIAATDITGGIEVAVGGFDADINSRLTYLGTVRGRLGYAMDEFLVYAHGGLAYGHTEQTVDSSIGSVDDLPGGDHTGYQVGAGVEYAVTENISFQTEYAFTSLGNDNIEPDGFPIEIDHSLAFHSVKAGVNFRF